MIARYVGVFFLTLGVAQSAWAFNQTERRACTVTVGSGAPVRTICVVESTLSQGAMGETVTVLPGGTEHQIDGDLDKLGDWQVDGEPAVVVDTKDLSKPCYRTTKLEICLGR